VTTQTRRAANPGNPVSTRSKTTTRRTKGKERQHPPSCLCRGTGWVCEDHPWVAFAAERPVTCWCEAPGMPCPGGIVDAPCEVCGDIVEAAVIARTGRQAHEKHLQPDELARRRRVVAA
jgi:hypothetical protein